MDLKTIKGTADFNEKSSATPLSAIVAGAKAINTNPMPAQYDGVMFVLPEFKGVDFTKYRNVTVQLKFFDDKKEEVQPTWQSNAIVSLVYDVGVAGKDLRGGKNVPLKEFNGGMKGGDATVSTDKGSRTKFTQAPGGLLLQKTGTNVKYIEVSKIVFHNGEYKSE